MSKLEFCELGDLIEFQRGYDLPKSDFVDGPYPVQSSNGILGYHNEFKVKGPSITIGRSGTVGIPHLIEDDFFPHNTSLFIKDFKGNDVRYIYYLLKSLRLGDKKSGSSVPTMNRNHLHPLKIKSFRDVDYQNKLSCVLNAIDKKIKNNNKINSELEASAKLIYDYWFVQFNFPDKHGNPYKSSGGIMVFNEELNRYIPDGWEVHSISEKLTIGSGYSFSSNNYINAGKYKVVTIKNIQDHGLKTEKVDYVKNIPSNMNSFCILEMQDILISLTGKVGRLCLVNEEDLLLNQRVGKFLSDEDYKNYIYLTYLRPEFRTWMERIATGSNQKNLSPIDAVKIDYAFPPSKILEKFNALIMNNISLVVKNSVETKELKKLRDWLLPMLMNGQVKIN